VARLVQVGLRDVGRSEEQRIRGSGGRVVAFHDADLALDLAGGKSFAAIAAAIVRELPQTVYISWDIDGLDPALCPSTGTPVPGGLSWHQATLLLAALAGSGRRVVGMDLCEVAPARSGDEWDANVAARLLYKMIGFALLANDMPSVSRRSR
jgi:agmatinase